MRTLRTATLVCLLALPLALPPTAAAQLQWFGYAAGAGRDLDIDGTAPYTNWGQVITDQNPASTYASERIEALSQRNLKAIVELGKLLWYPNDGYRTLHSDYTARWNTWKTANQYALTSGKVLGFIVRDEPMHNRVNAYHWEAAAKLIRRDFPWAKILMVEAGVAINCYADCPFYDNAGVIQTVDWVGVSAYRLHPVTDTWYQNAVATLKQYFPGRKTLYVADGFWDDDHVPAFGSIGGMGTAMREWYDAARNDPDAVLLAAFIWGHSDEFISSVDFPLTVLNDHVAVGRTLLGRVRSRNYLAVGVLERIGADGCAEGWACDPDGAWSETVGVHFYADGRYVKSASAAIGPVYLPQCKAGIAHRFRGCLSTGSRGKRIVAYAQDLDSGLVQLPSLCAQNPACVF